MITRRMQAGLDQILATSPQRLVLMLLAFGSVVGTSLLIAAGPTPTGTWLIVMIAVAAAVVAMDPDEHLGSTVIALVVLQWLASDTEPTSAAVLPVAVGLLTFHSVVALLAVTPHTSTVPTSLLVRWATRWAIVVVATAGVWAMVNGFDGRTIAGARPLTILAVGCLAAAVVIVRSRSSVDRSLLTDS